MASGARTAMRFFFAGARFFTALRVAAFAAGFLVLRLAVFAVVAVFFPDRAWTLPARLTAFFFFVLALAAARLAAGFAAFFFAGARFFAAFLPTAFFTFFAARALTVFFLFAPAFFVAFFLAMSKVPGCCQSGRSS
ncbi:MAG TPA: hypothetical protein VIK18_02205 [Pirellulales bacterium]